MAVCNKTGAIAVYNSSINLFLSPFSDGPLRFEKDLSNNFQLQTITKYGRSFSILKIPYSLKLIIQELQGMNVQLRIITDTNIDQLLNMSYSDNINKLLKVSEPIETLIPKYIKNTEQKRLSKNILIREDKRRIGERSNTMNNVVEEDEESENENNISIELEESPDYASFSPAFIESGEQKGTENQMKLFVPHTPENSPPPLTPLFSNSNKEVLYQLDNGMKVKKTTFDKFNTLPEKDRMLLMTYMKNKKEEKTKIEEEQEQQPISILDIETDKNDEKSVVESGSSSSSSDNSNESDSSPNEKKTIIVG